MATTAITTEENWTSVSSLNPCKTCGKPDYCSSHPSGSVWLCRRQGDPGSILKTDKSGVEYWLHFTGELTVPSETVEPRPEATGLPPATAGTRHKAYSALLGSLTLSPEHARELPPEAYNWGYRTCPQGLAGSLRAAQVIRRVVGSTSDALLRIPGVRIEEYTKKKDGELVLDGLGKPTKGRRPVLDCPAGYFIPVRDSKGLIVALKIRRDITDKGKYLPLRGDEKGSSAGQVAHIPFEAARSANRYDSQHGFIGPRRPGFGTVRITEGEKKADVATSMTGIATIGLPSATAWALARGPQQQLHGSIVRWAPDADVRTNPSVCGSLIRGVMKYRLFGTDFELESWSPEHGKGIDDVLLAGHADDVLLERGLPAFQRLREWAEASGAPVPQLLADTIALFSVPGELERGMSGLLWTRPSRGPWSPAGATGIALISSS